MKIIKKVWNCQFEISDHFIRNQKKFENKISCLSFVTNLFLLRTHPKLRNASEVNSKILFTEEVKKGNKKISYRLRSCFSSEGKRWFYFG